MSTTRTIRLPEDLDSELVMTATSLDVTTNALVVASIRAAIAVASARDMRLSSMIAFGRCPRPEHV
jgi:predicted transcriptional regulator